jgi:phosphatidylglycerol---prolipoprotein diacylglyceryl transferase
MKQVLFTLRGHDVYAYPFMLYVGITVGVLAGTTAAGHRRLNQTSAYVAMLLLSAAALAGARLLFVVANWRFYRREPRKIWRRSDGGYALYGGLLLALLLSVPLLAALRVPFAKFWDAAAITILTGMIFAKLGCFLNGCCAGCASSAWLSFHLPDAHGHWSRRLPAQLLEAAFAAVLLAGALASWHHMPRDGSVFLAAAAAYGCGRWLLESAREGVGGLSRMTLARKISAALVVLSIVLLAF